MAVRSKIKTGLSCVERKALRSKVQNLSEAKISKVMFNRYGAAVRYFVIITMMLCGPVSEDLDTLDKQVQYFINLCWSEGEPKWLIGDTLSGISHFLQKRRILSGSWKLYNVWDSLEDTVQAPPMPLDLLAPICGWFLANGRLDGSVSILRWFHCCLRTGEGLKVRWHHFIIGAFQSLLTLPDTKGGKRKRCLEKVTIEDGAVFAIIGEPHAPLPPAGLSVAGQRI